MEPGDGTLEEFAGYVADTAKVRAVMSDLRRRAGAGWFYVFLSGGNGAGGSAQRRSRTLLAFASPDAALTFAQRNRLSAGAGGPRLRRLSLGRIILAMVRERSIGTVLIVRDADDQPAGQLPNGLSISRANVMRDLGLEES